MSGRGLVDIFEGQRKHAESPAFPVTFGSTVCRGLSLREWYAGMAMQGFTSTFAPEQTYDGVDCDSMAAFAFRMADALLDHERREREAAQ